jgi:hypothetical protein
MDPVELEITQELAIQAILLERLIKQDEREKELRNSINELKLKLKK